MTSTSFIRQSMLPLIAALVVTGSETLSLDRRDFDSPSTRQCWEECVHEIAGRCFLWKKRCETIPDLLRRPQTGDLLEPPTGALPMHPGR